jgi:hypothetical protein
MGVETLILGNTDFSRNRPQDISDFPLDLKNLRSKRVPHGSRSHLPETPVGKTARFLGFFSRCNSHCLQINAGV